MDRQASVGLNGWFDGVESSLFPLPPMERANRLIAGFGGRQAVRAQSAAALAEGDVRWALELATWLVRSQAGPQGRADGGSPEERAQLAAVLRTIAQRTTSANIRSWCSTRALELEGQLDLGRLRGHHFRAAEVQADPAGALRVLRVLLDPPRAQDVNRVLAMDFGDGCRGGLHIRHGVAVPTAGEQADVRCALSPATWAQVLAGRQTVDAAFADGSITMLQGDAAEARRLLACFDHPSLGASH